MSFMQSPIRSSVLALLALTIVGFAPHPAQAQSRWPNTVEGAQQRAQDLREVIAWLDATIGQAERGEVLLIETGHAELNHRVVVPVATTTYSGVLLTAVINGELREGALGAIMAEATRRSMLRTAEYRRQRADLAQRLQGMERSLAGAAAAPPPVQYTPPPVYAPPPSPGFTLSDGPTGGPGACPTPSHWNITVTMAGGRRYDFKAVANGDGSVLMAYPSGDRMHHIEATGGVSGGQLNIQARDVNTGATSSTRITLSPDCLTGTGSVRASRLPGGEDYSGSAVAGRYY
jgi:hypothetical protein